MDEIKNIVEKQQQFFHKNHTKSLQFRKDQLETLKKAIKEYEQSIYQALKEDLNKSKIESFITEIYLCLEEINYAKKHLKHWMRKKYVYTPISQFPSRSYKVKEPYGVVAIISPWNYPFLLSIQTLIGAIAAGNCAIIKMSEYAPRIATILKEMIEKYFEREYIAVLDGGVEVADELLNQPLDYIFFTGSTQVGKIVMEKASKNLTPVTLELGGKSPCIIDETVDISLTAKRIIFGKLINGGQTCVAPDYIFVKKELKDKLVEELIHWIKAMYGTEPLENENYPKIISKKHFERLMTLMEGEECVFGGYGNKDTLQITPTLLVHVSKQSPIMKEEIFGPILPILTYQTMEEVVDYIKQGEKPLALYLFSKNKKVQKTIMNHLSFGGGCINDTLIHLTNNRLPFGGVGASGMGQYHGKYSFSTFSHEKGILVKGNLDLPLRYQPFTKMKQWVIKIMLRK